MKLRSPFALFSLTAAAGFAALSPSARADAAGDAVLNQVDDDVFTQRSLRE